MTDVGQGWMFRLVHHQWISLLADKDWVLRFLEPIAMDRIIRDWLAKT
ncbi:MAG: hypothetical protein ACYS6K_21695 [Planctomycetota bacterium]